MASSDRISTPEPIEFPINPQSHINANDQEVHFPDVEEPMEIPKKKTLREKNINKPTPFTGDRKKVETFIQECKMYLRINRDIYTDDDDKIGFVLSFMNEKEALRWKQTFLRYIINRDDEMEFPPFKNFIGELLSYFQPTNTHQEAAHQMAMLKQGSKTAEEVITEFRLLISLAGYSAETPSDNLHLIEKLRGVLNPALVKKVMLLDNPPTTLDGWIHKAIAVDSNYRMTMDILGSLGKKTENKSKAKEGKKLTYADYFKNKKYREEKDPMAMDIDAMSTEKRITLMKKGACFICEKPGHLARDHDEYMKKERKENTRGSTSFMPKKNINEIHALLEALSAEETKELLALQNKAEEKKDDEEDF
jgi:hypothetical protein